MIAGHPIGTNHAIRMKRIRRDVPTVTIALLLLFAGCSNQPEFLGNHPLEGEVWYISDTAKWTWPVKDTTQYYDLSLAVQYSTSYPYANLYLFVGVTGPDGATVTDTLNSPLCSPEGKWYGEGFGSSRTIILPYRTGSRMAQMGNYTFTVLQGMRMNPLPGLRTVSLIVHQHQDGKE